MRLLQLRIRIALVQSCGRKRHYKRCKEYLFNLGGYGDYKYNLTEMPRQKFLNKVIDVACKVDMAYYKKRKQYRRIFTLIAEKYAKIVYHAAIPYDIRCKLKIKSRFGNLKKAISGRK